MSQHNNISLSEEYIAWAARHQISRHTVCRVLFENWKLRLNEDEKQYLSVLAQIYCPADDSQNQISEAWAAIKVARIPQSVKSHRP
jgi:hypothetical protein